MKMVCIKKGQWITSFSDGRPDIPCPQRCPNYGEIVTVDAQVTGVDGQPCYYLAEYNEKSIFSHTRRRFTACNFRPLIKDGENEQENTTGFDFRQKLKENV